MLGIGQFPAQRKVEMNLSSSENSFVGFARARRHAKGVFISSVLNI